LILEAIRDNANVRQILTSRHANHKKAHLKQSRLVFLRENLTSTVWALRQLIKLPKHSKFEYQKHSAVFDRRSNWTGPGWDENQLHYSIWKPASGGSWFREREQVLMWHPATWFISGRGRMSVATGAAFTASSPKTLFLGRYQFSGTAVSAYDVSPDGTRFLMVQPAEDALPATQIHIVLNWLEELKK
jgi:hypothetical protein